MRFGDWADQQNVFCGKISSERMIFTELLIMGSWRKDLSGGVFAEY